MTEAAARRIEQRGRGGEIMKQAAIKRAQRCPVSLRVRNYELPAEFVERSTNRVEALIRLGNWEQAKAVIDAIELEWELTRREKQGGKLTGAELLACPVCRLRLNPRTINLCEHVGAHTVGALLERFPGAFLEARNCGPVTLREIAQALVDIGALTPEQAAERLPQEQER